MFKSLLDNAFWTEKCFSDSKIEVTSQTPISPIICYKSSNLLISPNLLLVTLSLLNHFLISVWYNENIMCGILPL